ncbi:hypothetical protein E4U41_000707 [Claviceps citrina]|nr:hypothetical protein E4U41_000707 [Claviceps citrina]
MGDDKIERIYETRTSFRKLLSQIEADEPESFGSLPALHPRTQSARPGSGNRANDDSSSNNDASSNRDSITSSESIPGLSTPPSSIRPAWSSSPAPFRTNKLNTASSPSGSITMARPSFVNASSPLGAPSLDQTKARGQDKPAKKGGGEKDGDEASLDSDDILGPYAHKLESSTRKKEVAPGSKFAPTLKVPSWPELEVGARVIKRMRKDGFDLESLRERQAREDAHRRKKEERRLANKRKYRKYRLFEKEEPEWT